MNNNYDDYNNNNIENQLKTSQLTNYDNFDEDNIENSPTNNLINLNNNNKYINSNGLNNNDYNFNYKTDNNSIQLRNSVSPPKFLPKSNSQSPKLTYEFTSN